ncbi:MAG TPA: DUF4126 domain-containing protein [Methanoregulaceae archaeon]|nr:DUF4126 domain-containing protein [Methanoregulaceae archaeon]
MIETVILIACAIGLSVAAGLNAYLPLLVVGLVARSTTLIPLNEPWDTLTNGWVLAALAVLLVIEMTADKIPVVDSLNDIIQTVGRPLAGAILFIAGAGVVGELHPALSFIAGLLIAGGVHAAKVAARPAVTLATGGTGNWLVSLIEDLLSLTTAVVAILAPLLVLLLITAGILLVLRWKFPSRKKLTPRTTETRR